LYNDIFQHAVPRAPDVPMDTSGDIVAEIGPYIPDVPVVLVAPVGEDVILDGNNTNDAIGDNIEQVKLACLPVDDIANNIEIDRHSINNNENEVVALNNTKKSKEIAKEPGEVVDTHSRIKDISSDPNFITYGLVCWLFFGPMSNNPQVQYEPNSGNGTIKSINLLDTPEPSLQKGGRLSRTSQRNDEAVAKDIKNKKAKNGDIVRSLIYLTCPFRPCFFLDIIIDIFISKNFFN
jgi:hypothetical protein